MSRNALGVAVVGAGAEEVPDGNEALGMPVALGQGPADLAEARVAEGVDGAGRPAEDRGEESVEVAAAVPAEPVVGHVELPEVEDGEVEGVRLRAVDVVAGEVEHALGAARQGLVVRGGFEGAAGQVEEGVVVY